MPTFTIHEAKTNLSKLIARARAGEDIVIARGKQPVVRLQPLEEQKPRRVFGALKGKLSVPDTFFEPLPEDELKRWWGEAD